MRTDRQHVLATVYRSRGKSLVCLASWEKDAVDCRMAIDWKALGLDPARTRIHAPPIEGLQKAREFQSAAAIPVAPRGGWMLLLEQTPPAR